MSFLDNLRDRFTRDDDYYDDEGYDDQYEDEDLSQSERGHRQDHTNRGSGLLGNTPRPEAESVSVYTRSGRPVASNQGAGFASEQAQRSSVRRESSYTRNPAPNPSLAPETSYPTESSVDRTAQAQPQASVSASTPQLPPYVLKPEVYDDVQMVIRRVRTNQPVILILTNTAKDIAQRILDFSFGLSCGIDGNVQALSTEVFAILPKGTSISDADIQKLEATGDLTR